MLPHVPAQCTHNSHLFYIRILNEGRFERLLALSKEQRIGVHFHALCPFKHLFRWYALRANLG